MNEKQRTRLTREQREWAAVHLARSTVQLLINSWKEAPSPARRKWLGRFLVGFLCSLAATVLLVFLARWLALRGVLDFERPFLERFAASSFLPYSWAIWIESPGNSVILWPLVLLMLVVFAKRRHIFRGLALLGGFALADVIVLSGWMLWKRERPAFIDGGHASPSESFSAFPSGHVVQAIVAYGLLIWFWSRVARPRERIFAWALLCVIVAAVAVSRLRLGAHWPSDIVAALIIGSLWLLFLIRAVEAGESGGYEGQPTGDGADGVVS